MDDAPLTLAHSHARKAAAETSKQRLTVAATEHEAAADQYHEAQQSTSDVEALRMLGLLEYHHRQLSDIIRSKDQIAKAIKDAKEPMPTPSPPPSQTQPSPSPSVPRIHTHRRESSPALAKDMATRRGIPKQHTIPPAPRKLPAPVAVSSPPPTDRRQYPSPPLPPQETATAPTSKDSDDGFGRFYSNWTSGPFSRLSSMLAFAALPLTEQPQPDSPTTSRHEKTSARATNDPDIKSLISPAALNALQKHGQIGPGESFYIIPPSGGTASYASVLSREQRYARRQHLSNINEDDAEFVDAQETQSGKNSQRNFREEELQLENDTLKQVLDQMSHRLQAFESHAQDASMAALNQSMISVRTQSSVPPRQLEDDLQAAMKEIHRLKHDNGKYKSYFSKLKESARTREEKKRAESGG